MPYEFLIKKTAPAAAQEEETERAIEKERASVFDAGGVTQGGDNGAGASRAALHQRLQQGYDVDKASELREFRQYGYNKEALRVDIALLNTFLEEFSGIAGSQSWYVTASGEALKAMINLAQDMDIREMNGQQRKVMLGIIDLSRQATDTVMLAALYVPLGEALLAAGTAKDAVMPSAKDIDEARSGLGNVQDAIRKTQADIQKCIGRISADDDSMSLLKPLRAAAGGLSINLTVLDDKNVSAVRTALAAGQSSTGEMKRFFHDATHKVKTTGSDAVDALKKIPHDRLAWKNVADKTGTLAINSGKSVLNKVRTIPPLLNSQRSDASWEVSRTYQRVWYGALRRTTQPNDAQTQLRESLRILAEPIYIAAYDYLNYSRRLAATPQDDPLQRTTLGYQREAAFLRVQNLENVLERETLDISRHSPDPGEVTRFLDAMKKALRHFWQAAERLNQILKSPDDALPADNQEPVFAQKHSGKLIDAEAGITASLNQLEQSIMTVALKPIDLLSVDWRIARDIGQYFYAQRDVLMEQFPQTPVTEFDAAVEEVIRTHVAKDFSKASSPQGKQMAARALLAYQLAAEGETMSHPTAQQVINGRDSVAEQLAKQGRKILPARLVQTGITGDVGILTRTGLRAGDLVPNLSLVQVAFSPFSFWNDYRKLSRAVTPGEAFSWDGYRKMLRRNVFRQAFRLLKFILPNVAKTGLSAALAAWALQRKGVTDTAKTALIEGAINVPVAGGVLGGKKLAMWMSGGKAQARAIQELKVSEAAISDPGVEQTVGEVPSDHCAGSQSVSLPEAVGPSQIKRNIESSETNVSPPDHSQRSQNAIVVDRKLAESSRGSGALQQAGNSVVASEQGTNAAETDTEKTLSRSRRAIFPSSAPVSDESLETIATVNGSAEEIIKDKLLDMCKRYNVKPSFLYEENITLTYTNGAKANFEAHTIKYPPPSQSYVPTRYRGSITQSINVSIVDLATGNYAEKIDNAACGGKLALLSHNIKWPKEIPEDMRAEIMEGPFDKIFYDAEQTYKFAYTSRNHLGIKRIREILKKHNIDYRNGYDKVKVLSIHVNGWNRGGGDLTLLNCFLIGDTVYFNDSDGTSIKVSDLNKFLENGNIPDKYKKLIIDGISESDMESLKKYNDTVEDIIFKKSHNGFSWPFSEMHTPKINVSERQSFEKLTVAIGEDLSGKTYRSLNDVITTRNDIKNKKIARVVTGLIKSAGLVAGPAIGATASFAMAAAEKVPDVVEITLRDKDGDRLEDLKGAAKDLAVDAALLGASKGSKVFASNNVGGIVDKNRSGVLETTGQIKDALETHGNASEEMEKESKDENSQENQRDTITAKNENSENDSWILAENNANNANNVLVTKIGDDIDILANKPIIFTVEDTEGKKTEYVFKTQNGVSRFRAAGIIAEEVNDKNIGFKIGEMTESGIKPVNSQYKNKIWVKKGVNGKPMYKVSSRIGKT